MTIEIRNVRIVNVLESRDPSGTDILDLGTGGKILDVYRAAVTVDGQDYEVSRRVALPFDYEGTARLERGYLYRPQGI